MDFRPTPIAIVNRAAHLAGRAGARVFAVLVVIACLPEATIAAAGYGTFMEQTWGAGGTLAVWVLNWIIDSLAFTIAYKMLVDEIDGPRRSWTAEAMAWQVAEGAMLFARGWWLSVPLLAVKGWLLQVNPLACAALWYVTVYVVPAFVIERRRPAECARNALTLAQRHTPGMVVAVVLTLCLQVLLTTMMTTADEALDVAVGAGPVASALHCVVRAGLATIAASWTMGMYACLRGLVDDRPDRVADLFE